MGLVELQERKSQVAKLGRSTFVLGTAGQKATGGISVGSTVNGTALPLYDYHLRDAHGIYVAGGYECRSIAGDLLSLSRVGSVKLDPWELGVLRQVRASEILPCNRQRLAVHRIRMAVDYWLWWELPPPCLDLAARAAKEALEIASGEPKQPGRKKKTRRKSVFLEAEIRCPVCRTGAVLYCWTGRGGKPAFSCRNTRCVKKV